MQERQFGTFKRAIQLPPDADVDKISSSLNNGVFDHSDSQRGGDSPNKSRKFR